MEHLPKTISSIIKKHYGKDVIPSFTSVHLTMDIGDLGGVMGWKPLHSNREVVPGTGFCRTTYVSEATDGVLVTWTEIGSLDGYNSLDVTIIHPVGVDVEVMINSMTEVTSGDDEVEGDGDSQYHLYRPSLNEGDLSLIPIDIPVTETPFDEFFIEEFLTRIYSLSDVTNEDGPGLTIICGPKNTGKTTIITMLPELTERTCIFIPNNMIDVTFGSPLFYDILDEIMNPILILDDTENYFRVEMQSQNAITNNILQLLEGPIDRNVHLVIVSNDSINKMDKNLTRSRTVKSILETSRSVIKTEVEKNVYQKGIRL